jgi:hypothetical protein
MDAKKVQDWKARQAAVNRLQLEEKLSRTPQERLRLAQAFVSRLAAMDQLRPRTDDLQFHLAWQTVRERWIEQHAKS